jgi:uncharacterized protein
MSEDDMRLTHSEVQWIKTVIRTYDQDAQIYLFGSRVDDCKRGGDIDLLIFSHAIGMTEKRKIRLGLYDRLGEQKIDLIVAQDTQQPFVRIALEQAIRL